MENLARDKFYGQDRDDAFFEMTDEDYCPEKDKISDKDINYHIGVSTGYLKAKGTFIQTGGVDNVTLPSTLGPSFLITSGSSFYGVREGIEFVEVKPEASPLEWQQGMSDSDVYHIDFELNEPVNIQGLSKSLRSLQEVYQQNSVKNWDGYGAAPISIDAYSEVTRLLTMLPSYIPLPDIIPEPDGGIGLEWYKGKGFSFVISASGKNIITYVGRFGENNQIYGTENFMDTVPQIVLNGLKRLFSNE